MLISSNTLSFGLYTISLMNYDSGRGPILIFSFKLSNGLSIAFEVYEDERRRLWSIPIGWKDQCGLVMDAIDRDRARPYRRRRETNERGKRTS